MAGKGILNYTTTVDPGRTAVECIEILTRHGARHVALSVGEDRMPDGLEFVISTPFGPRQYALPVNIGGTHKALLKAWRDRRIDRRFTSEDQAKRVGWRVLKDWLEAQLALYEAGVLDLPQIMLPYMKVDAHRTLYAAWQEDELKAIEGTPG